MCGFKVEWAIVIQYISNSVNIISCGLLADPSECVRAEKKFSVSTQPWLCKLKSGK